MSGTKACDVSKPLTTVEEHESEIIKNDNKISGFYNSIKLRKEKINLETNKIEGFSLEDVNIIKSELPEKMKLLENNLSNIKQNISSFNLPNETSIKSEEASLRNKIKNCNNLKAEIKIDLYRIWKFNSGEKLEDINKTYNDSSKWIKGQEAINVKNKAENLAETMENIKNNHEQLVENIDQLDQNCEEKYKKTIEQTTNNLEKLKKDIITYKGEAENIKKIRNEVNALKDNIANNFNLIDKSKAKKFLTEEFANLALEVDLFNNLSNEEIIKTQAVLSANISKLKSDSEQAYNAWLAKKNYSEYLLKNRIEKGESKEVSLIEDLLDNSTEKIANFAYFDKYNKTNHQSKFNNLISAANTALSAENFDKCNDILEKANNLYYEVSSQTSDLRIKLESEMNLVLKMRDIMEDLGFDKTEIDFIDDDVMNGFYLNCQNGDTINFEEIRFGDDGELIINLDHTEGTGEGCGVRWAKIQKAFNANGIALMDVTKNGNSVIYHDKVKTVTKTSKGEVQNG